MACSNCSKRTLELFLRGAVSIDTGATLRPSIRRNFPSTRHFSAGAQWARCRPIPNLSIRSNATNFIPTGLSNHTDVNSDALTRQNAESVEPQGIITPPPTESGQSSNTRRDQKERKKTKSKPAARDALSPDRRATDKEPVEKEPWMVHKAALQKKLQGEKWSPRKRLSPDTMDGIRHLHKQAPDKFTTPVLAEHFKVSPEAIRRILKSKWRPSDEEYENQMRRWERRGETIWSNLVDLGVRPPKKWRDMGVGKAEKGSVPKWKTRWRNQVAVNDSIDDIPLMDERPGLSAWEQARPIAERIL